MVWTKKPGAPDYAYAIEELRAIIFGTPDAWLSDWLWLLGGTAISVAPLCAAGPRSCEPFTELDFLGAALSGNRAGLAINLAQLVPKLQCFAEQRLFGAYCEEIPSDPTYAWRTYDVDPICVPRGGEVWASVMYWGPANLPAGTSLMRCTMISGLGGRMYWGLADPGMVVGTSSDDYPGIYKTGMGGTNMGLGGTTQFDFSSWLVLHPNSRPFLVAQGGNPPTPDYVFCAKIEFYGPGPGTPDTYTPPDVFRPPSAIAPPAGVYDDIADLGAELDHLERKLDILLEDAATRQVATLWPLVPAGAPFAVANDEDIAIPEGGGLVVAVTNIGNQTDETFGEPRRLHRLGRVTVGSDDAWLPPWDITVTPLMLVNLPLEVRVARVHVMPPAVAQVQILTRANPVG